MFYDLMIQPCGLPVNIKRAERHTLCSYRFHLRIDLQLHAIVTCSQCNRLDILIPMEHQCTCQLILHLAAHRVTQTAGVLLGTIGDLCQIHRHTVVIG